MALDGVFLNKLVSELKEIEKTKINKIYQLSNDEFIFNLKGKINSKLLISLNPTNYRIHLSNRNYVTPKTPTGFAMLLRKHLEGGIIDSIEQISLDRILVIKIIKQNELRDREIKYLILELVGKASNLIITNSEFLIIDSLKHVINPQANKLILPKTKYEIIVNKKSIYNGIISENVLSKANLQSEYYGISPLLYEGYTNNITPNLFLSSLRDIDVIPVRFKNRNKDDFYFFNILNTEYDSYESLSELLDDFYYNLANRTIIRQKTNNLETVIRRLIERTKRKIDNQEIELSEAMNNEELKINGELLTANLYAFGNEKLKEVSVFDYYKNDNKTILLDSEITVKDNSIAFFNKYQKMKSAVYHINIQIEHSKTELEYLELIQTQILLATLKDIEQIKQELVDNHYLSSNSIKTVKKKEKLELSTYFTSEGTEIIVGKNNLQNEYITHKLAKANELWFHVKDAPGSHVLIKKTENFTENEIRTAAMLAAYYSTYSTSSSVAVCYTQARYIKKIPGKKNCFVTFSNEKTIFIDPDSNIINNLKIKM